MYKNMKVERSVTSLNSKSRQMPCIAKTILFGVHFPIRHMSILYLQLFVIIFLFTAILNISYASATKFQIGDAVEVFNTGGVGLNLRECPSTACLKKIGMPDGTRMTVRGGPADADGYTWWYLDGYINSVYYDGYAVDEYLKKVDTYTIIVDSLNLNEGVKIEVSPDDINGDGNGTTPFKRVYLSNTVATLSAPSVCVQVVGAICFKEWQIDGIYFSAKPTIQITMDSDHSVVAIFKRIGCEPETVSVSPKKLKLKRKESYDVAVTVTGADDCNVEGIMVKANIGLVSRQFITVTPKSNITDSNGQAIFKITAKNKLGISKITFSIENMRKSIIIKIISV